MRTNAQAVEEGKIVKAMLKNPKGWRIHTWNNLGWHVCLRKGGLSLNWSKNYDDTRSFFTLLGMDHVGAGETFWTPSKHFRNPNKAIEHQIRMARTFLKRATATVDKAA